MNREDLIKELGNLSKRSFQRWCKALNIGASQDSYSSEEVEDLMALKANMSSGMSFDAAIAAITGESPQQPGNEFSTAVVNGFQKKLKTEADAVGAGVAVAFEDMVWGSFLKHLSRSKGGRFEQAVEHFSFTLDTSDPIDAYILEAGSDED